MAVELFVYGDESGLVPDQPYCVVAGFIASPAQWNDFNQAWRRIVSNAGVTEFHSKPFFDRRYAKKKGTRNPFKDWPEPMAGRFLEDILGVIKDHPRVTPVGGILENRDFFTYTWGERRFLSGALWNRSTKRFVTSGSPNQAYTIPFFAMLGEAIGKATPPDARVHLVMDEQKVLQHGIQRTYADFRRSRAALDAHKIGDLTAGLSHEHEGIQAADLLAYLGTSAFRADEQGNVLHGERRHALRTIFERHKYEFGLIARGGLEHILDSNLSAEDRELIKTFRPGGRKPRSA